VVDIKLCCVLWLAAVLPIELQNVFRVSQCIYHTMFDICTDLAARSIVDGKKNNKAIDKTTFLKVFKLPGMLGERLFDVFDRCVYRLLCLRVGLP
jgi:hypothetical protein